MRVPILKTICALVPVSGASPPVQPDFSTNEGVVLAVASRGGSVMVGGGLRSAPMREGSIEVFPFAFITSSYEWQRLPCDPYHYKNCPQFELQYLKKAQTYHVISSDGYGATVRAEPTSMETPGDCPGLGGRGSYSGARITESVIAASSTSLFASNIPPQTLGDTASTAVLKALGPLIPDRLDSGKYLHVFALRFEGKDFLLVQRSRIDIEDKLEADKLVPVFAIGTLHNGQFEIFIWKEKEDWNVDERMMATIRLKNGRDLLITKVVDEETYKFRVYGLLHGKLTTIYSGGGGGC